MSVVLEARGVTKRFVRRGGRGERLRFAAIQEVDLELLAGEALAVVGESGCGKSTLLRCLAGFHPAEQGQVLLRGEDGSCLRGAAKRRFNRRVQLVFQDPSSALDPRLRIGDSLSEAMSSQPARNAKGVAHWLEAVQLEADIARRFPHQISGGQRQRVNLARALAAEPEALLLDEPFSALDPETRGEIGALLAGLRQELQIPMILVGHDLATLRRLASRVAVMYLGRIIETGTVAKVLEHPSHPYTRALLAAEPRLTPGRAPAEVVEGEVPIPWNPPVGCAFHPRCTRASELCRLQVPSLAAGEEEGKVACHHPYSSSPSGV